jgi:hypothetical protein
VESWLVKNTGNEVIHLLASIAESPRSDHHHEHLQDFKAGRAETKGKNVFISADRVVFGKAGNVFGIIEISFPIRRNHAGVILSEAFETPAFRRRDVRFPISAPETLVGLGLYLDAAIDDWNQVSVGDEVENTAPQGAINAREKHIAVERISEAFFFGNAGFNFVRDKIRGSSTLSESLSQGSDLWPMKSRMASVCVKKAIEIDEFYGVEINQRKAMNPGSRESFGHDRTNAARAYDSNPESGKIVLNTFAPRRNCPP